MVTTMINNTPTTSTAHTAVTQMVGTPPSPPESAVVVAVGGGLVGRGLLGSCGISAEKQGILW